MKRLQIFQRMIRLHITPKLLAAMHLERASDRECDVARLRIREQLTLGAPVSHVARVLEAMTMKRVSVTFLEALYHIVQLAAKCNLRTDVFELVCFVTEELGSDPDRAFALVRNSGRNCVTSRNLATAIVLADGDLTMRIRRPRGSHLVDVIKLSRRQRFVKFVITRRNAVHLLWCRAQRLQLT